MTAPATGGPATAGAAPAWKDKKRYLWILGLVIPTLPLAGLALQHGTGQGFWLWLTPVAFLGVIPVLDLLAGYDDTNPPDEVIDALENDRYYRWVTYLYLPVQYVGFVLAVWYLATADLTVLDKVGLALSIGTVAGVAINTAHELGHKRESHERWFSKIALAQSFYGHFYIEHNRGHHVRVATPEDPASARMGESVYRFWPRTVVNSLRSAWGIERKRYARKGTHPFHLGNDVLNAWAMSVVLWGALVAWLGVGILPYLVIQAVMGFTLLEVVNYMEHYGMLRQKVGKPGKERYERVTPAHSWNSNNIATNVLLYHLQRHSDHHANPTRRYQVLRDSKDAPVLPTGYTGMIVVALFPPLFRALMDKRVVAHYDGDLRLANLHPAKREKLLAKYPVPEVEEVAQQPSRDRSPSASLDPRGTEVEEVGSRDRRQGAFLDHQQQPSRDRSPSDDVAAARCPGCGHTYEVAAGNEAEGFAAGTSWSEIPDDWCCPDCGVREKVDFVPLTSAEVA